MDAMVGLAVSALAAWLYLLLGHGGFWRAGPTMPSAPDPAAWPDVVAVVPARDEAEILPATLPTLLRQRYAGSFEVVVVDDQSADRTSDSAIRAGASDPRLHVVPGSPPPPGWAGKVWAMAQGVSAAGGPSYLLFADADIAFGTGAVAALVRVAEHRRLDLVSRMATLHMDSFWERQLVPAFVYFFAQLYPFRRVNRPRSRVAAAAGGCMLVRRTALEAAGGLQSIHGALIDDVALGRMLKRRPHGGGLWLGLDAGGEVVSVRPHRRLSQLWEMVARSAYTQLRHSRVLLAATLAGLVALYAGPPVATVAGAMGLATGGPARTAAAVAAGAGLCAWFVMAATYAPTLRRYGLSAARALALPVTAMVYAGMTIDSARRHRRGAGGAWKGRAQPTDGPAERTS